MAKREIIEKASYLITRAWCEAGDLYVEDKTKMDSGLRNLYYSLAFEKLLKNFKRIFHYLPVLHIFTIKDRTVCF